MKKERKPKEKVLKQKKEKREKNKAQIISELEEPLEKKIEESEEKINKDKFEEFFEQLETPKTSPSLKKINPAQRIPTRLEENVAQSSSFNEEEENEIKYNLIRGENKKEEKYSVISQQYSAIQKETIKHNPHILTKEQSFIDLNRKNIVENFPKRSFNPFAEEALRNQEIKDDKYISKFTFQEKERKPHNPFEKKEIEYNKFEQ